MKRVALLTAVAAALPMLAQEPAFEVASIKPTTDEAPFPGAILAPIITGGPNTASPTQISYRRVQLTTLIARAFELKRGELPDTKVIPPQLQFDILANVPPGATPEQVRLMEQHLLRERFGLRYHREPRTQKVYVVRLGKDGPKFRESPPLPPPPADPDAPKTSPFRGDDDQGFPIFAPDYSGIVMKPHPGTMAVTGQRVKVGDLLQSFETYLGRPIVDETGLTGLYDFRVQFLFGGRLNALPDEPVPSPREAIALLGLTLEEGERPIDVLVIEEINLQPTEN